LTISTIAFFLLHGTQARERGEISIGTTITNKHIGERGDRSTEAGSMKIGPISEAARTAAVARDIRRQLDKATHLTHEQKVARLQALLAFDKAVRADIKRYRKMEEDDVVEEYRRAGKLHNYDKDKEWKKRFARVAKLHPCHWGKQMMANIEEYMYYLEGDEDDFKLGLYSLIGDEILG
jgi:hypothetical protein